jgi:C-3',4' desaturase CrtD
MAYEVVVVGGGIGGLTTAALLSARGKSVCLIERQSELGGCLAPFEKFGYSFESGFGLYPGWKAGEIHDRIFAELPVAPPEVRQLEPAYSVRFPDLSEALVSSDGAKFFEDLRTAFPECAEAATSFFKEAERVGQIVWDGLNPVLDLVGKPFSQEIFSSAEIRNLLTDVTLQHMNGLSPRFKQFIDAQLQLFGQAASSECAYLYACMLAATRERGVFGVKGGASALSQALADSIRKSGGTIRLNAQALRLAYDSSGSVSGVILLTGETVQASVAVISNLPVWDTYGKLVGLNNTPSELRSRLKDTNSSGVYQVCLGLNEESAAAISCERILAITNDDPEDSRESVLAFSMAPEWDNRAPEVKRAATVSIQVDVNDWFTYHVDESQHEEQDAAALESVWARLIAAIPELDESVELIETFTPRTAYESTRRKLGMVGGLPQRLGLFGPNSFTQETAFGNLFLVGDTVFPGAGAAAVSYGALALASRLTGK